MGELPERIWWRDEYELAATLEQTGPEWAEYRLHQLQPIEVVEIEPISYPLPPHIPAQKWNGPTLADCMDLIAATPQWQAIETAPKDGSEFLAFYDGLSVQCRMDKNKYTGDWFVDYDYGPLTIADFTHWMPLPTPPPHG